ncbi:unnamed protein product, partial [Mesorhabditis spiculigera]
MDCGVCILLGLLAILFAWIAMKFYKSGLMSKVEVITTDKPTFLQKHLVVYYKHVIGHYKKSGAIMEEARGLLPAGATTFGIYYDDPDQISEQFLQSAAGAVYSVGDEKLFPENYTEQLTRWGYEKMTLPIVEKAVETKQPFDGFLSLIALVNNTYTSIKDYVKDHRLETTTVVEIYTSNQVHVLLPLDHSNEFLVPEYTTVEELESRQARKRFDSDESDSESEPFNENEASERSEFEHDHETEEEAEVSETEKKNE